MVHLVALFEISFVLDAFLFNGSFKSTFILREFSLFVVWNKEIQQSLKFNK